MHPRLASANHPNSPPPFPIFVCRQARGREFPPFRPRARGGPESDIFRAFLHQGWPCGGHESEDRRLPRQGEAQGNRGYPPRRPPPPYVPVLKPGSFGFVENAERWNSRASMVGWWSLLLVELVAGKGLLEIFGFTVGKGINFTF